MFTVHINTAESRTPLNNLLDIIRLGETDSVDQDGLENPLIAPLRRQFVSSLCRMMEAVTSMNHWQWGDLLKVEEVLASNALRRACMSIYVREGKWSATLWHCAFLFGLSLNSGLQCERRSRRCLALCSSASVTSRTKLPNFFFPFWMRRLGRLGQEGCPSKGQGTCILVFHILPASPSLVQAKYADRSEVFS